jgi:hypothetical protein
MAKTVKTPAGTELPLVNLKGKDYLMVGHRLQWFNEIERHFDIKTEFLLVTDEQTICKAHVSVKNENGEVVRQAQATKRETRKDFPDHTEKAETSAIGRALAILGYGTQFALSDLDEGERLADSPMVNVKANSQESKAESPQQEAPKKSGFGVKKQAANAVASDDGWN